MTKTVLITGSSGGFGKLMSETLLENHIHVIATMRDINGRNKQVAQELAKKGAKIIELDVCEDSSVKQAVENAISELGTIDIVVNNAGVGVLGFQESFTPEDLQKLFDINVFGVHRVIRAVLPHFREKGKGTIINVSSLLGRMTIPFFGPYNASKWALEALTENYRTELSQYNIDVLLLEPGGFPTSFMHALMRPEDSTRDANYEEIQPSPQFFFENFEKALASNPAQNPQNVADALLKLIDQDAGERPFRTIVDKMGMGDHLGAYNKALGDITAGIYGAFGIDHLLKLKSR